MGTIAFVLATELRSQEGLLRTHPREERGKQERHEQHAGPRSKSKGAPQRTDQQPQVAGMADNTVHTARDQLMPWLNGDQSAEIAGRAQIRPDPQRAARGEEENAKPANRVPVEHPDLVSIRVGGQICAQ